MDPNILKKIKRKKRIKQVACYIIPVISVIGIGVVCWFTYPRQSNDTSLPPKYICDDLEVDKKYICDDLKVDKHDLLLKMCNIVKSTRNASKVMDNRDSPQGFNHALECSTTNATEIDYNIALAFVKSFGRHICKTMGSKGKEEVESILKTAECLSFNYNKTKSKKELDSDRISKRETHELQAAKMQSLSQKPKLQERQKKHKPQSKHFQQRPYASKPPTSYTKSHR